MVSLCVVLPLPFCAAQHRREQGPFTDSSCYMNSCPVHLPEWGFLCSIACWAPPFPLMPEDASLFGSDVPLDSPLEGHLL